VTTGFNALDILYFFSLPALGVSLAACFFHPGERLRASDHLGFYLRNSFTFSVLWHMALILSPHCKMAIEGIHYDHYLHGLAEVYTRYFEQEICSMHHQHGCESGLFCVGPHSMFRLSSGHEAGFNMIEISKYARKSGQSKHLNP
jgi:hypothetical protein